MNHDVRRRVLELYAEVDRAVAEAGPVCIASGRCCRFKEYGHTLFLSRLEADVLLAAAPPYERPASADSCPFQQGNLCTAREPRSLGCRIYYCDPNYQDTAARLSEEALGRLKRLADEFGLPWHYAPLHHFLNEPDDERRPEGGRSTTEDLMSRSLGLVALLVVVPVGRAADWPQWLGPTRDGVSTETVAAWKTAPAVLWRKPVGEGNSSPVVAAGRVYLHAKVKDRLEEEVVALDAKSGEEVWRRSYARGKFDSPYGNGPRATPAVVDGRLFTYGITGSLIAWEATTGKEQWRKDVLEMFGAKNLFFGASCSPLVEGKSVLVNTGAKGASIAAFRTDTGEPAWKTQDDAASYASPIIFGEGKSRQAVFLTGAGVVALAPDDGALQWRFPLRDLLMESSTTPALAGDVVLASSITYGSAGLQLGTKDGKPTATELWKNKALTSYFSTPVAIGDVFYLVTGKIPNPLAKAPPQADLHCVEAKTGKSLWKREKVGRFHASLLRTGDGKLLMLEDTGGLVLLEPSKEAYREVARSSVCGETWAHPALTDGRLYVRDDKEILCLQMVR